MPRGIPLAQRAAPLLPALALLLLALLGCNRGLWTPDEPREAEISREMALAPSVIPTLNGHRFIEKPPLYYWTVAAVYRLTGGASVLGARAVSVAAGVATLALVVAWGTAAHSRAAGWLAALMLATSVQFMVSSHWVLLDPLLMLCTTLAAWAAWELLARRESTAVRLLFYLALVLALWIKGLIGPVLIGAGLTLYVLVDRPAHWRRLRPITTVSLVTLAVLLLGLAIWSRGGRAALWEWGYVNHVQRVIDPGITGHRQPLLYYGWTLPFAALPWLPPLLEALRPAHWRRVSVAGLHRVCDPARYGALMSAAMVVVLSLSLTKRETYLLPALPLLFLWLGIRSYEWWQDWQLRATVRLGMLWWLQVALLCAYVLAPPLAGWIWRGRVQAEVLAGLLAAVLCVAWLLYASATGRRERAGPAAVLCAVAGSALTLGLAPALLDQTKDMGPFVRWIGRQLPADRPVFATGVDETLAAEFPFYTGRAVVTLDTRTLRRSGGLPSRPDWVVVQDNHDGRAISLAPDYTLIAARSFGPHRSLLLWRLAASPAP
ncbi:MAG TPA: phospholipid carrier-dependent glycosyltransferase [Steroidobacteraceae bacterium]